MQIDLRVRAACLVLIVLAPWSTARAESVETSLQPQPGAGADTTLVARQGATPKHYPHVPNASSLLDAWPSVQGEEFYLSVTRWSEGGKLYLWVSRFHEPGDPPTLSKDFKVTLFLGDGRVVRSPLLADEPKWLTGFGNLLRTIRVGAWFDLADLKLTDLRAVQLQFRGDSSTRAEFRPPRAGERTTR